MSLLKLWILFGLLEALIEFLNSPSPWFKTILCWQHALAPLTPEELQENGGNHQRIKNVIGAWGQWWEAEKPRDVRQAGSAATEELFCYFVQQLKSWPWGEWGKLTGGRAVTRANYTSGRQFGGVYPMRVNSSSSIIDQSFRVWACLHGKRLGWIHFWMTEPLIKLQQIIHTHSTERWGNHEDLWCRKTCISRFISRHGGLASLALVRIKSFHKRRFHNVPFNCFTNQGCGRGYYLEDAGIKIVIRACNKNTCCHLWPKHSFTDVSLLNLFLLHCNAGERDNNFTDAFIWSLTFSVAASILDLYLSAPLRLARW